MNDLKQRWQQLFAFSANQSAMQKSTVESGLENLLRQYAEKHRFYHTIEHIKACLGFFDEVKSSISDAKSLEIALWFHDVIYDPIRNDNEAKSALFAKSFLESIHDSDYDIQKIEKLILQTKHPSKPTNSDEKYLIDIDLAILGASIELYNRYETWIRKEYKRIPDLLYKKGRKKVLNSFIDLERIYQTDYFYKKFEVQARKNLNAALNKL